MTSQSNQTAMKQSERADYAFSRIRDAAYDAVMDLWRRRKAEGMTQIQLAEALGGDAGWLSRNLRGPGNWTLRTVGRFVDALNGEVELKIHGLEDPLPTPPNYHAYIGYEPDITTTSFASTILPKSTTASSISGRFPHKGNIVSTAVLVP